MKKGRWLLIALAASGIAFAQWRVSTSVDQISGVKSCYAISPTVKPLQPLGFPYGDLVSWIGVGVKQQDEWGFIGFSQQPNLVNGEIGNGYHTYELRVRWDRTAGGMHVVQDWGSRFLHPVNDRSFIKDAETFKTLVIELKWYGQGSVYFRYPLSGAAKAIRRARAMCRK